MSTVTIDGPTRDKVLAGETVEVVDETGNPVGKVVAYPRVVKYVMEGDWPSGEELERRLREGKRYTVDQVNERIRQLKETHG